ncbi:MAG: ribosome-associated translation inhibitor RaiA [Thermoflexales bacterium]|nr:ribosome-associated translation inhibitor RaiA [Thermoflexales bacterium]
MEFTIQGHGSGISSKFETYIRNKAARLERLLPGIEDVRVEVNRESAKDDAPKSLQLTVRRKRTLLRVEERNADPYTAFDSALDKMYHRIARYKGRRADRKRSGVMIDDELAAAEALPEGVVETSPEQRVVRLKHFAISPMSVDEAIEQMELLGHDFFVFMNESDGSTNVAYRRKSGGYGVLQPEK